MIALIIFTYITIWFYFLFKEWHISHGLLKGYAEDIKRLHETAVSDYRKVCKYKGVKPIEDPSLFDINIHLECIRKS